MTSLLAICAVGFILGMRHATDPDHVVAVSTIVARHRSMRSAAAIGVAWGVGHTLTILVVGGAIVVFHWVIPPRVGLAMELSVGVMLIGLGMLNLSGRTPLAWLDGHLGSLGTYQLARPLVVGIVHGLAGSAAVTLLVLTAIPTPGVSLLYLLIFGIGTIAGMMLITAGLSVPFVLTGTGLAGVNRGLRITSGVISVCFGLFVAWQTGIVNGLFTGHPQWTPR